MIQYESIVSYSSIAYPGLLETDQRGCLSVTRCCRLEIEAANQRSTTVPAVKAAETGRLLFKPASFSRITERLCRRSHPRRSACRRGGT